MWQLNAKVKLRKIFSIMLKNNGAINQRHQLDVRLGLILKQTMGLLVSI